MNVHDMVLEVVRSYKVPITAPVAQSETNPRLSYAVLLSCLNDLVRRGELKEGQNEVGKRTFEVK